MTGITFNRSERLARQLQEEEAREYEQSQQQAYQQIQRTHSAPQNIPPAVSLSAGRGVSILHMETCVLEINDSLI